LTARQNRGFINGCVAKILKKVMLVSTGICWLFFAGGFVLILIQHLNDGADIGIFHIGGVSSLSATLGLAGFIGFAAAAFVCIAVGFGLCAYGLTPGREKKKTSE
jgi:hypothetical protein